MTIEQSLLQLIFPREIFEWFNPVKGEKDDKEVRIVFEEKNIPPLVNTTNKKIISTNIIKKNNYSIVHYVRY